MLSVFAVKLAALQSVESTLLTKTLNVTVKHVSIFSYRIHAMKTVHDLDVRDGKFFFEIHGFNDFSIVLLNQLDIHVFIPPERKILQFPFLILKNGS